MNVQLLRQSPDFQSFLERVKELGTGSSELIKIETSLISIGRLQGRLTTIDDVVSLLDQIEAEQRFEER